MPVDLPMPKGNSVHYVAERGFCSGTTFCPHGFSFSLLNLVHGFCGSLCLTELAGYLTPAVGKAMLPHGVFGACVGHAALLEA
jgi:hypothetical protein